MGKDMMAYRAALHYGEEPFLAGDGGSGAVFFSGCSLRCVYCQNKDIALLCRGEKVSVEKLSSLFLALEKAGAENIDLVTAAHFAPDIKAALQLAKEKGLRLPVIYNSSGYEEVQTLKMLEDVVDIYLPDFKYFDAALAGKWSLAPDYRKKALLAIKEMVRQKGWPKVKADGRMQSGTLIRHMVLPGHTKDSQNVIDTLFETFGKDMYISLMSQYTPVGNFPETPELNRKITKREYEKVLNYALDKGIVNGFFQETASAGKDQIPSFHGEGLHI